MCYEGHLLYDGGDFQRLENMVKRLNKMNIVKIMTSPETKKEAETTFEIGELARELGVSTRTIRFYEEKGIVNPERKGNTRIFKRRDKVRLILALRGKRLGFSLDEVSEYLELYSTKSKNNSKQNEYLINKINDAVNMLEQKKQEIEITVIELKEMKAVVEKDNKRNKK